MIDAVRVRAKVAGSWKQAQPEVEKLANEIRDMGLRGHRRGRLRPRGRQHLRARLLQGRRRQGIAAGHRPAVVGPPGRRRRRLRFADRHQPHPALPDPVRGRPADRRLDRQLRPQAPPRGRNPPGHGLDPAHASGPGCWPSSASARPCWPSPESS